MSDVIITEIEDVSAEGLTIKLNKKAKLPNSEFESKSWFLSWDKIGTLIFKDQYTKDLSLSGLKQMRADR